MGQGYSLTTLSAGSAGIDVPELADLSYEKSLGSARFMKCIRARHKDGVVVAKVVMKPYSSVKLNEYVKILLYERKILADIPNALPYHRILETSTTGFLVRQYIHSSLYDRISTRPFLEDIEKKWLSFQLLCAVRDCHDRNIFHGDIKTENTLVTSWNWLYLSDFSSCFKPTYLPEDNPADFSFYFDTSQRRTCYLAPERFTDAENQSDARGKVNWAMDIFSVGCVIAELFLETPIFTLSQLFKYRKGEYDPEHSQLHKIHDKDIRELILHMIQLDPQSRYQAEEYLKFWRGKTFPDYFYSFLHQYMFAITDLTSGQKEITAGVENLGEADDRIDKIYFDFDKIAYFLGYEGNKNEIEGGTKGRKAWEDFFPLDIDIPNNRHTATSEVSRAVDDGTLLFLSVIVSSIRSTARATARLRACELLLAFAERCTDEAKLDRILPYVMALLNDKSEMVQVAAIRSLTQILALVSVVSPINAYVFPEYVLPRLAPFVPGQSSRPSALLRATYASCLASLADTASRFLDMMQALRAGGSLPTTDPETEEGPNSISMYHTLFDTTREDIIRQFETQTKAFLTDTDSAVKRAFLGSVARLCVFFGSVKASDVIISHLNTYLNDRDWMLKCAFFETIVGVATFIGGPSLEEFILPLMVQALTDPEEFVVERVLRSFASIAHLGLFQRSKIWELVDIVGRFTMHPNIWIREAAAQFISSSTKYLSLADIHSIIIPLINPYLKVLPSEMSELKILDSLKKSIPRTVLDLAATWAMKAERGLFWKPAQNKRAFSFGSTDDSVRIISAKDLGPKAMSKIPKNEEDEQWLSRLRHVGMTAEDELKLVALREYIWRAAHRGWKNETESAPSKFNVILPLTELGVMPQTVMFETKGLDIEGSPKFESEKPKEDETRPQGIRTISDALLDASTTLDDPISRRKRSHVNSHLDRIAARDGPSDSRRTSVSNPPSPSPGAKDGPVSPTSDPDAQHKGLHALKTRSKSVQNSEVTSPVDPAGDSRLTLPTQAIQRKGSALNLLNRGENKTGAATSTTSTNAFGQLDHIPIEHLMSRRQSSPLALAQEQRRSNPTNIKYRAAHSYKGNDPSILQLLDSLYLENYPGDYIDFGPLVHNVNRRQPIKRPSGQTLSTGWKPEGVLVAMLGEHSSGITRVVISPDHTFFITGSDDGFVKVWDASRLERNISHRSRQTFRHAPGTSISSLNFVENTHCFISTATDGSINVVKVDCTDEQGGPRYGKLRVLREYHLSEGEYATWTEHFKHENQSVLLVATNTSRILALEIRTMSELYTLHNPVHHGVPTAFAVDRKHHWLLLGTSHGVLDLWDLRFKLRLKGWVFPGASPIHRVTLQGAARGSKRARVCIAGGTAQGEVTVWDMEKVLCREVYRTGNSKESPSSAYSLLDVDEERAGGMLGRFAMTLESSSGIGAGVDRGVRAVAVGTHIPDDGGEPRHQFVLSAGPDWKVRFWDASKPENCTVVSGLEFEEPKPTYTVSHPGPETVLVSEKPGQMEGSKPVGGRTSNTGVKRAGNKPSRSSVISLQQQQLLKSHLDVVTDVALLEWPYGMVISVDRSGVIYAFS
ncbi:phosphoinositide 3-kinase regulatory subunit 4 [Patellaria atrata CBS 101060]|uniref:non-specific serine/threonine protein kinase n=1 Tax=Patellaria atrata CBS 101060 TaxID=1346257 RepID=A0A9P4SC27_9PEZI|nr:phosphoinositide 3-kinase regulatory subunit 4 [Patellaria atrata CBS 101060]